MSFEDSFETNNEEEPDERSLSPEEIEKLGSDMGEYVEKLKERIDEIERLIKEERDEQERIKLKEELDELQVEYDGLAEFIDDIDSGDFDEIIERPQK